MPSLPNPGRLAVPRRRATAASGPAIVVLGDLVVDVVIAPDRDPERGTDVTGRVMLRQGGSAASTARWLGRLGTRSSLICAIGRDAPGRALVAALAGDRVTVRAVRVAGARTGRIGVIVEPGGGQRSFVTDRGAALRLRPEDVRPGWLAGADALHLPAYSLLDPPLGDAGQAAAKLAHAAGALVSVDLASSGPLLARGRQAALSLLLSTAPDLLLATRDETRALVGKHDERLLDLAPIAVVKRGRKGATILARDGRARLRFEVATSPVKASDTTGAGDAFNAGFLAGWLDARRKGTPLAAALQRGAVLGNRTALRHLSVAPVELVLGG
jgi:ribokinase